MNKLALLLKAEQSEQRLKQEMTHKTQMRQTLLSFPAPVINRTTQLLQKVQVLNSPSSTPRIQTIVKPLKMPKPPLKRAQRRAEIAKKEVQLTQTQFLCTIMQEQSTDLRQTVNKFLNGEQGLDCYKSLEMMETSANSLYKAARDMSKTLEFEDGEALELKNLKERFITSLKLQQFQKKPQNFIVKRNYGQKFEMLIDQVRDPAKKNSQEKDFDVFIPKEELDNMIDMLKVQMDEKFDQQHEELMMNERKLIVRISENQKQFKDDMREVAYTMNHLRKRKTTTGVTLKTNESQQSQERKDRPKDTAKLAKIQKTMDDEQRADLKLRVRKALRNFIDKLKKLNITIDEIVNNQVFPSCPFERPKSFDFFIYIKQENIVEVESLLKFCRFHVYDVDNQLKTGLHHAAGSGALEIIKMLVEAGADLDARDMMGRTPLHIAAKNNKLDAVRVLLVYCSNPSIKTIAGKRAQDLSELPVIKALMNNARKLHFMMELLPRKKRKEFWMERGTRFFQEEDPEKILKLQLYNFQSKMFLD